MADRTWKDRLLASGVPLEYSVLKVFESLGVLEPREFHYERLNEAGQPTVFSVDVHASHVDVDRNLWLELLVECKYRHDGTRWVFGPRNYEAFFSSGFPELFVVLDQFDLDRKVNTGLPVSPSDQYPLCERGVELLPKDFNPKSIEQAIQQLRYAVVAKSVDALQHQAGELLGSPTPLFMILPIVVTTAELWRMKPDTTIDAVRESTELADVATQHEIVVVRQNPDNLAQQFARNALESALTTEEQGAMDATLRAKSRQSFPFFVSRYASRCPSLFLFVHYDRFARAMRNVFRYVSRPEMVQSCHPTE